MTSLRQLKRNMLPQCSGLRECLRETFEHTLALIRVDCERKF